MKVINYLKIVAVGAAVTVGLASAATAQQSGPAAGAANQAPQHKMSGKGGMMGHADMTMMKNPEMRKQMEQMMGDCRQMMKKSGAMSNPEPASKS